MENSFSPPTTNIEKYVLPTNQTDRSLKDTYTIKIRQNTILVFRGIRDIREIISKKQGKIRIFQDIETEGGTSRPRF